LRLPPVRHLVRKHRRLGKTVADYKRGDGKPKIEVKKTKPIKEISITKVHPRTPSGRLTQNLCTLSKGQTLLWEDDSGSERVILGTVSAKVKPHLCPTCWKTVLPSEKAVMTQDYFPFRHHMVIKNVYHVDHFPFDVKNLVQAEKDIERYMSTPRGEYSTNNIYTLENDTIREKFANLAKFRSP